MSDAPVLLQSPPASPFLKWVGGKGSLVSAYRPHFPPLPPGGRWHEPFIGGGALFFAFQPQRARLADVNPLLVDTWKTVRDDPEELLHLLRDMQARHSPVYYYEARARLNVLGGVMTPAERAAHFLYINRAGFNGLWRVSRAGKCNVPVGRHKSLDIVREGTIRAASAALRTGHVVIERADFAEAECHAEPGDTVYFDPPYVPVSATSSFTGYATEGFSDADQVRLRDLAARLAAAGVTVRLSNSVAPRVRELYAGEPFRVMEIQARRSVNSKADRRGPVGEVLVLAGPESEPAPERARGRAGR